MSIRHEVIQLNKNKSRIIESKNKEVAIIVSTGEIRIKFDEATYCLLGNRENVFETFGESIYLPIDRIITIEAVTEMATLSVLSVECENPVLEIPLIKKECDLKIEKRGTEEYYREVSTLFDGKNGEKMIIGETLNKTGLWSGYPPHKHDKDIRKYETKNSELYYVKVYPEDSFAMFLNYKKEINSENVILIKNDETVIVNEGYHSIAALPKNKLYYLWALINSSEGFLSSVDNRFVNWRIYD